MTIKIEQAKLAEALNKLRHVAKPTKSNLIFQNVHVQPSEGKLTLTAINETSKAVMTVPVETDETTPFLVECAKFADIINTYNGELELEYIADERTLHICKEKAISQLPTVKEDVFPLTMYSTKVPDAQFILPCEALKEGFTKASAFTDPTSSGVLSGVNVAITENNITFSGCDGNRLIRVTKEIEDGTDYNMTLPKTAVVNLTQFLTGENVYILLSDVVFRAHCGDTFYYTRVLEGQYPKVSQLIPTEFAIKFSINKNLLKPVLERIKISETLDDRCRIHFSASGLMLEITNPQKKVRENFVIEKEGEDINFTLDRNLFSCAMNILTNDNVEFNLNAPNKPVIFSEKDTTILIMPMF